MIEEPSSHDECVKLLESTRAVVVRVNEMNAELQKIIATQRAEITRLNIEVGRLDAIVDGDRNCRHFWIKVVQTMDQVTVWCPTCSDTRIHYFPVRQPQFVKSCL